MIPGCGQFGGSEQAATGLERAQNAIQGFQARTFRAQYGSLGRARGLLVSNRHLSQRCCNAVSEVNLPYSSTNPAGMVVITVVCPILPGHVESPFCTTEVLAWTTPEALRCVLTDT
jgi:hypothetical protein